MESDRFTGWSAATIVSYLGDKAKVGDEKELHRAAAKLCNRKHSDYMFRFLANEHYWFNNQEGLWDYA